MELIEIKKKQNRITDNILEGKIAVALPFLSELVYMSHQGDYISSLEGMEETYKNILKYSFGQTRDPERELIYNSLKRHLIELTDDVVEYISNANDEWIKNRRKEDEGYLRLSEREKSALIDELATEKEFTLLLGEIESDTNTSTETSLKYAKTIKKVFEVLWLKGNYSEGEKQLAHRLVSSECIPWHDKSLMVSAISLSLFRHFDIQKIELLFDIYAKGERQIAQRALVGLILSFLLFRKRLELYPEIINRLKTTGNPKDLAIQTEQIVIQIIKSQETEKVTEKIQKEIIPEVMKIKPEIEEKLKLDELLSKDELEDENPDWENFFSDSPDVYKKLEEFSMMQMDGSDVFMGAFSMLKRFVFFDNLSNWFLPFYKDHPEVKKSISGVDDKFDWKTFLEGIEGAPVMCNSDKFSFCFNIGFMPDMQKSMMLELFSTELKQMNEISEDDKKHDSQTVNRIIFTQYIQDLYRFFKLYPQKGHFLDVFDINLDITDTAFLTEVFYNTDSIRKIGEFYFKKNYYPNALIIFEKLLQKEQSFELMEKSGFCYQKLGQYKNAIEKYLQAEIFDNNRSWLHKKLGYCYRKTGDFDKAVEYYKKVEHNEPDNLDIQAFLGQLHIDKEDYNEALKYYFKVEYLRPDFAKVQRPIGWCSFVLNKPDNAVRYFKKVIESEPQRSDYLNLAHCYWVQGKMAEAIENYRLAIKLSGGNLEWLSSSMLKDNIYLKGYGIEKLEIVLMIDYLLLDM